MSMRGSRLSDYVHGHSLSHPEVAISTRGHASACPGSYAHDSSEVQVLSASEGWGEGGGWGVVMTCLHTCTRHA